MGGWLVSWLRGAGNGGGCGFLLLATNSPPFTLVSMSSPRKRKREREETRDKDTSIKTTEIGGGRGGGGEDEKETIYTFRNICVKVDTGDCGV